MTEMDFDELDKAVSTLMKDAGVPAPRNDHPDPAAQANDTDTKTDASSQAASVAAKRRGKFMDVVRPGAYTSSKSSSQPLSAKREGVALQPLSAQDKKDAQQDVPISEPSAEAPENELPKNDSAAPSNDTFLFDTEPSTTLHTAEPISSDIEPTSEEHSFPDPIDFMAGKTAGGEDQHPANKDSNPDTSSGEPPEDVAVSEADVHEEVRQAVSSADVPLSSPFLPDAKVEKRPLGGVQAPSSAASELSESVSESDEDHQENLTPSHESIPVERTSADNTSPSVTLPAELSGAIMAVESSPVPHAEEKMDGVVTPSVEAPTTSSHDDTSQDVVSAPHTDSDRRSPSENHVKTDEPHESTVSIDAGDTAPTPVPVGSEKVPEANNHSSASDTKKQTSGTGWPKKIEPIKRPAVENGSILQQYQERMPAVSQENGAIYDTKTYHQPLDHPAKHKSSAVIIMWILVLIIIGALGGAALFYFRTQ